MIEFGSISLNQKMTKTGSFIITTLHVYISSLDYFAKSINYKAHEFFFSQAFFPTIFLPFFSFRRILAMTFINQSHTRSFFLHRYFGNFVIISNDNK